jgi:hypothetical protein
MLDTTKPPGNLLLGLLFTLSVLTALGSEIPWKQFLGAGDWPLRHFLPLFDQTFHSIAPRACRS